MVAGRVYHPGAAGTSGAAGPTGHAGACALRADLHAMSRRRFDGYGPPPTLANSAVLRGLPDSNIAAIVQKGKGRMPAFPLPQADVDQIVRYIRSLNAAPAATAVAGDAKAGEQIFFGSGQCATCHTAGGRGSSYGPDLSSIANRLRLERIAAGAQPDRAQHGFGRGQGRRRRRLWRSSRHIRQCHSHLERWQQAARGSTAPRAATTWCCRPRTADCTCCWMGNSVRWFPTLRPPCLPIRAPRSSNAISSPSLRR